MFKEIEKNIINLLQNDIPIVKRPYHEMSKKLNITEEYFLKILTSLIRKGVLRRFGATIRHQKSGYTSNAMAVWKVEDNIKKIGRIMAVFKEVSHCYQRSPLKLWPYNLYTMIHGKSKNHCYEIIKIISRKTRINDYAILFSVKELKKTSMIYFNNK